IPCRMLSLLNKSHLVDFFQCGNTLAHFGQRGVPQKHHALLASGALDLGGGTPADNHFANAVGQVQQFGNGATSAKSGSRTFQAAGAFDKFHRGPFLRNQAGCAQDLWRIAYGPFAMHANHADQTLRQNAIQCGNKIVRLNAHVNKPADYVRHIIRVHRGEHKVPRQRRLNGDLRGFIVADFSHHDLVRIVTQDGAQPSGKGQSLFFVDRNLRDPSDLIFHWVFNGYNFVFIGFYFVDGGIQCGCFARSCRPGDQYHSVRLANIPPEFAHFLARESHYIQAEVLKFLGECFLVQDAQHRVFSVTRGHDRNAEIDEAPFVAYPETSVLRHAPLGDVQLAHYFDARNDRGKPVLRNRRHGVNQYAVNSVLHRDFDVPGLDVNIRGAPFERRKNHRVYQANHRTDG